MFWWQKGGSACASSARSVSGTATWLVVMALLLVAAAGAASVGGSAARRASAASPAQATPTPPDGTYVPPVGSWQTVHGPGKAPLWADADNLRGVHGVMSGGRWIGWAVGEEGMLAHYDGTRWQAVKDFEPSRTAPLVYTFNDVFVKAPDDVWIVGSVTGERLCALPTPTAGPTPTPSPAMSPGCGTMVHYDGRRFTVPDRLTYGVNGKMGALNAIDMLQDAQGGWWGWAVGDDAGFDRFKAMIVRHTPEDGWDVWPINNIAKHLYDVRILAADEAWAVGQDGVESWYNERTEGGIWPGLGKSGADTLYAVDLPDPLRGWDGGFRGRMNKYHGHCHDQTLETQCWFDNRAIPVRSTSGAVWNVTIYDIDLLSRTEGWLVGAASGRTSTVAYLKGYDVWQLVGVADDGGRSLQAMALRDGSHGWAVGNDGTIVELVPSGAPTATPSPTTAPSATGTPTATATRTTTTTPTTQGATATPGSTVQTQTSTATDVPTASVTAEEPTSSATVDGSTATATADPTDVATDPPTEAASPSATTPSGSRTIHLPAAFRRR